jgi:hypothetical protein
LASFGITILRVRVSGGGGGTFYLLPSTFYKWKIVVGVDVGGWVGGWRRRRRDYLLPSTFKRGLSFFFFFFFFTCCCIAALP